MTIAWDDAFADGVRRLHEPPEGYAAPALPDPAGVLPLPDSARTQRILWLEERIARGSRVLDLGCGRGEILHFLTRDLGIEHLGLERQPEFIAECRGLGLRVAAADFNDLADPALRHACSQRWDSVLIIDSMVYWRCPALVLAALRERCARIFATIPNMAHLGTRLAYLGGEATELPNVRGSVAGADAHFSTSWFSNRWTVASFVAWGEALGYAVRPLARRSVNAKYLPLGFAPSLFARSVLFELAPRG